MRTLFVRESLENSKNVCYDVDQSMKRFWEIETCGTENETRIYTKEENEALTHVKESLNYDATLNRYTVGVPWKPNRPQLPDNKKLATSTLYNTERKLAKDKYLQSEYQKTIKDYIWGRLCKRVVNF